MPPEAFERVRPLVARIDRLGIHSVEHPAAVAAHVIEANFEQYPQVFRNRQPRQPQRFHNLTDWPFRPREAA